MAAICYCAYIIDKEAPKINMRVALCILAIMILSILVGIFIVIVFQYIK